MTLNTSKEALGRNPKDLVELNEEQLRDTHPAERHEASFRPSRTPSETGGGEHGAQTVRRTELLQAPSRIDERNRDNFLRFRDEWVRNRARDIRRAGSIFFNTCSEDTASITALNEFYRWRVFDRFKSEQRDEKELNIGMMQHSRDFGKFPEDVTSAEKLHMCRIVCREKDRRVFGKTCRQRANS
jgi:hypothetical protein